MHVVFFEATGKQEKDRRPSVSPLAGRSSEETGQTLPERGCQLVRRFPNEAVNWSARKFDIPLQLTSIVARAGGDLERQQGGHCAYCNRQTILKPSGLSGRNGGLVADYFTNPGAYSQGRMFSLDHAVPSLGHDDPGQVLQVTCVMCNYMMNDSPKEERTMLVSFLRGERSSPFGNLATEEQALRRVYADMCRRDKKRTSIPLQERLPWAAFLQWVASRGNVCELTGLFGTWLADDSESRVLLLSIDRVDSTLPYDFDNMQVILHRLNLAKNSFPQAELVLFLYAFCERLYKCLQESKKHLGFDSCVLEI